MKKFIKFLYNKFPKRKIDVKAVTEEEKISNSKATEKNKTKEKMENSKADENNKPLANYGKYHINFEGKIYPCKAKIRKCPYGDDYHADSKLELYYKLMESHGVDAEPSNNAMNELKEINRLRSLYPMSRAIENVNNPVDVVVVTLKESLAHLDSKEAKASIAKWKKFEEEAAEIVRMAYLNGQDSVPTFVPERIRKSGAAIFYHRDENTPLRLSDADREIRLNRIRKELDKLRQEFREYDKVDNKGLNHRNYRGTYAWMTEEFEKFSHDLNTSKMITQPVFYGDLEKAKETIRKMDNYELLAILDDYSVTDKEIEANVKEANYFKYKKRLDLSAKANEKMEKWYNRNRQIYENWKINTPRRILLSMEVANELDRRQILRHDSAVAVMLADGKWM